MSEHGEVKTVRMSDDEVEHALKGLGCMHPALRAVGQLIDDQIEDATYLVTRSETALQPTLLAHTAGGLEQLRVLKERIETFFRDL